MKQAKKPTMHSLQLACMALAECYPDLTPEALNQAVLKYEPTAPKPTGQPLTVRQVAAELGIHMRTVARMVADGEIDSYKVGKSRRICSTVVEAIKRGEAA